MQYVGWIRQQGMELYKKSKVENGDILKLKYLCPHIKQDHCKDTKTYLTIRRFRKFWSQSGFFVLF